MSTLGTTTATTSIRVLVVDDSPDIAEVLERCIEREPDMALAGSRPTADSLVEDVLQTHADVALLDLTMPGKAPLVALCELWARGLPASGHGGLAPRVIAYSAHTDPDTVASAALAGAHGYLSKSAEVHVILEAIRAVANGAAFRVWE